MLLRLQRDEIGAAVVVQVANRDIAGPGAAVQHARFEVGVRVVRGAVLQVQNRAGVVVAEHPHDQVQFAVAVEVGGLDVVHATDPLDQGERLVLAVAEAAQPDDAARGGLQRPEDAQVGDQDVEDPVAVQVDDGRMAWGAARGR